MEKEAFRFITPNPFAFFITPNPFSIFKPETLSGRSGAPLFHEEDSRVIGLVAWRTGDGRGLAMNVATVRYETVKITKVNANAW